jgi:probable rRNA maturation factor
MPISVAAPTEARGAAAPLRALVALVLRREGRRSGEIGVRLARDPELRELNRRWRGIDRATDVISFAYDEDAPDPSRRPVGGDLVLSLDRVREQARRFRVSEGAELARLVIHGTLHLAGHDHARGPERTRMRARENAALAAARALVRRLDAALASPRRAAAPRGARARRSV